MATYKPAALICLPNWLDEGILATAIPPISDQVCGMVPLIFWPVCLSAAIRKGLQGLSFGKDLMT